MPHDYKRALAELAAEERTTAEPAESTSGEGLRGHASGVG